MTRGVNNGSCYARCVRGATVASPGNRPGTTGSGSTVSASGR